VYHASFGQISLAAAAKHPIFVRRSADRFSHIRLLILFFADLAARADAFAVFRCFVLALNPPIIVFLSRDFLL